MKLTPMMQQYFDAKSQYPDCVLLFRMGDFYECFHDDAVLVAEVLELTLTSRDKDSDNPVPMAGVPHHAAEGYIRRLVERGYPVAVCEQLEDPAQTKGIVRRGVVRVVTPGMRLDADALDAKVNNFAVSIAVSSLRAADTCAVGCLDLSTGETLLFEVQSIDELRTELLRLQPAEVLVSATTHQAVEPALTAIDARVVERAEECGRLDQVMRRGTVMDVDRNRPRAQHRSERELRAWAASIDRFALRDRGAVEAALAHLVSWMVDTQGGVPSHVAEPQLYRSADFLTLDPASAANLEIFETLMGGRKRGSLLSVIDHTVTAAGGRRLRTWLAYPLKDVQRILERQRAVTAFVQADADRAVIRDQLRSCSDIQRLTGRLVAGQGNARDLVTLRRTLEAVPVISAALRTVRDPVVDALAERLDACEDVAAAIAAAIVEEPPASLHEGGIIRQGYDSALDELIELTTDGKNWLLRYEAEQRKATGINSIKVRYNRVFGYYIEVTRANADAVPDHYIRKQTLANAERYFTAELKEYEDRILSADERRHALEYTLYESIRQLVGAELGRLRETAARLAELDGLTSLAELAQQRNYTAPTLSEEPGLTIAEGRHPVVEATLQDARFVPNDTTLNPDQRLLLVTGPNMAGKSTVIRQVALIVLLAQIGSHVPASSATIGVVDQIFSRVGASDNLARGQSTFMVEMSEVAHILNHATSRSLVILDEIGRGTATYDGLSIAWSVAEHLHDTIGCLAMFATHYHELTDLAQTREAVRNANIAVREWNDDIIFLHRLVDGPANRSYGIQVARLAGVPDPVVARAREILGNLESAEYDAQEQPVIAREVRSGAPARPPSPQLALFAAPAHATDDAATSGSNDARDAALAELERADVNRLTPLDALNVLDRLQRIARGETPSRRRR